MIDDANDINWTKDGINKPHTPSHINELTKSNNYNKINVEEQDIPLPAASEEIKRSEGS